MIILSILLSSCASGPLCHQDTSECDKLQGAERNACYDAALKRTEQCLSDVRERRMNREYGGRRQ